MPHRTSMPSLLWYQVVVLLAALGCQTSGLSRHPDLGSTLIQVTKGIPQAEVARVMVSAGVTDLNEIEGGESGDLVVKLFAVPVSGSCVPESHTTCAFDYYLAVSEYDEDPRQSVFHLGVVGEVSEVTWMKSVRPDAASIRLRVANYPRAALDANPSLDESVQEYRLDIRVEGVTTSVIR